MKNRGSGNVVMEKDGTHWDRNITNEEVLGRAGEKRTMADTVVRIKKIG